MTGGMAAKPAIHFPTSEETMSTLAQTVKSTYSKLEYDEKRSGVHVRLEQSMQLRMGKVTETHSSLPGTDLAVNSNLPSQISFGELSPGNSHELPPGDIEEEPTGNSEDEPPENSEDDERAGSFDEDVENFGDTIGDPKPGRRGSTSRAFAQARHRQMSIALVEAKDNPGQVAAKLLKSQMTSLQDAFYAIAAAYDLDGDGTLNDEEICHIFGRCGFYDEKFTRAKVMNFFHTWALGCNKIIGKAGTEETLADGIGVDEFEQMLKWYADVKGVSNDQAVMRVIRLSRKLCDGQSSQSRRLETHFDAVCQKFYGYMTLHEFIELCASAELYTPQKFSTGDAYSIFSAVPNRFEQGIDFEGFVWAISRVGEKLDKDEEEMKAFFAARVGTLAGDQVTITRVKYKMKHAASITGAHEGWQSFFLSCDEDNSGFLDWDEFHHMCRDKLGMTERENHLKLLFEQLDTDDSGELTIGELIEFIEKP